MFTAQCTVRQGQNNKVCLSYQRPDFIRKAIEFSPVFLWSHFMPLLKVLKVFICITAHVQGRSNFTLKQVI